jgi:RNA polymerase sigma-70 factor (ECF subfamily)
VAVPVAAVPESRAAEDPDLALVRRVQTGEVSAFNQLVLKYRERVYSVAYHLTSNREDAADVTQDVFIKAFASIGRFRGGSSFFTWLYRIAFNASVSHLKKSRRRRFFNLDGLDLEAAPPEVIDAFSAGPESERTALMSELQEKLNDALQKLSVKHRTVVVLFEIDGLSHQEISEITGCSVGTVRSRLHYAKQQLQAHLESYLR